MSLFDVCINLFESFSFCLFIFLVFNKKNQSYFFIFFSLCFIALCLPYPLLQFILLNITLFIYACFLDKNNYIHSLFLVVLADILSKLSLNIASLIYILSYTYINLNLSVLVSKCIFLALVFITSQFMTKYHILEMKKLNNSLIILLILDVIYNFLTSYMTLGKYSLIFYISINILIILLCIVFYIYDEKLTIQKNMLELKHQEDIYQENQKSIHELNKWKHDINHVFNTIGYHLNDHNIEEAQHIINEYNHILNDQQLINSQNELLDYILSSKINIIKEHDIHLTLINNISFVPIDHTHLSIIIGNLLDNAIENCGKDKEIILDVGNINNYFYIKISNSIDEKVLDNNPQLLTTKYHKEDHGMGLNNINLLLDRYDGKISFDDGDNYFTVRIIIPM